MNEKKYFFVDFKWDDVVFCANIAHKEVIADDVYIIPLTEIQRIEAE